MEIKICGLRNVDNIKAVAALIPDYMGFVFYPESPRYVGHNAEIPFVGKDIQKIGVFVNEPIMKVLDIAKRYQLDAVQLHGEEDYEYCKIIRSNRLTVFKAISIAGHLPINQLLAYTGCVDYFLFDTTTPYFGGSGQTFDWEVLAQYPLDIPFFISGGLGVEQLNSLFNIKHPLFIGVDANSKLESEPGIKHLSLTQQFIKSIRDGKI